MNNHHRRQPEERIQRNDVIDSFLRAAADDADNWYSYNHSASPVNPNETQKQGTYEGASQSPSQLARGTFRG